MPDTQDDLIGAAEAAEILGVDRSTLASWARDGKLKPAGKIPGRTGARLFRRGDVERLRDAMRAKAAG